MAKEFLLNCDTKIAKSIACTAAKHDDEHFDITKEVATDVVRTITESIMPISELTAPYVVAALRSLANGIEEGMDPLDKEYAKVLQILMGRIQFKREVERV